MTMLPRRILLLLAIAIASFGCTNGRGLWSAEEDPRARTARYVLATAAAFRTVYMQGVIEHTKRSGVTAKEGWIEDGHSVMLPAQFVKAAGFEIKEFELGLIGLTPIEEANLPRTPAEREALEHLAAHPETTVRTFADGDQFKGVAADFAIAQACADCHNAHAKSPKRDFRQGDAMGAIIVRIPDRR